MAKGDVLNRLRVIMAAPDIDEGVFTAQLDVIGRMRTPITVLVAPDDRALQVSSFLGAGNRVGALDARNPEVAEAAKRNGVAIVDISSLEPTDVTNTTVLRREATGHDAEQARRRSHDR